MMRRGASFDISFFTDTIIPRRSIPSSCALIPIVVLIHVPRAVATRSVGENASPLPLLSVGASVAILALDGPCTASQCKSPVYLTEMLTIPNYAARFYVCHVERSRDISYRSLVNNERFLDSARNNKGRYRGVMSNVS